MKQLLGWFIAAKTASEREILLQGVRIVSAKDYEILEESIIRNQVRAMPLPKVIGIIAEQRNIPNQHAEEMVPDLILDHLLDRAKLRLDASVALAPEVGQDKTTPSPSVPPIAAPDQVKILQPFVHSSSNPPQRLRPAVVILKETEEPHRYPPLDLEQRAQHSVVVLAARENVEAGSPRSRFRRGVVLRRRLRLRLRLIRFGHA